MSNVADLTVRQGDTSPVYTAYITDPSGSVAVDLTGATCTFVMRELNNTTPTVSAAMTVTSATAGVATYTWTAADTAIAGLYMAEVHVLLANGSTYTYPNGGYQTIQIEENLTSANQTLVSLSDAKDILNVPADDITHDAKILRFVRAVQVIVESQVGPVVTRTFDEWYDGGSPYVRLRYRPSSALGTSPVLRLIACSEYVGPIEWPLAILPSPDIGQLYSCMVDPSTGTVVRRTAGGGVQSFPAGPQAVHVVYQAGQSQVPWNIYEGTLELLREQYRQTQQVGYDPFKSGDEETATADYIGFLVSGKVRQWLVPMRRHPSIA